MARGSGTPVRSIETEVPYWTEPQLVPPTIYEPPLAAVTEPAVIEAEANVQPEPAAEVEAVPAAELPKTASPLTVMLTTAIVLVSFAAAMQLVARRKRT